VKPILGVSRIPTVFLRTKMGDTHARNILFLVNFLGCGAIQETSKYRCLMVFGGQNETGGLYDMALRCFFLAQHAQVKLIFRTFIDYVPVYVSIIQ